MSKKAAKRLAKRALKLEKTVEKSARQFAEPVVERLPKEAVSPDEEKSIPDTVLSPSQALMRWNREMEDDGVWSWGVERRSSDDQWTNILLPFLEAYQIKKWGVIDSERTGSGPKNRRPKHCYYTFGQIIDEAYQRLVERQIDDFAPNIFRFRISGKKRLYGFRVDPMFHLVWFDPDHRLYRGRDE